MAKSWDSQPYARVRQARTEPYRDIRVINPSRGLNTLISDTLVNDKEATEGSRNIEFTEGGVIEKRPGYKAFGTGLTNPTKGIGQHISEAGYQMLTVDGGVIKRYNAGAWAAVVGAVTLNPGSQVGITSLAELTYFWDGQLSGIVYDGTTATRPGTMPKAKFSVPYKGYHAASGVDGQPYRVYFAPAAEPSRFTRSTAPSDPTAPNLAAASGVPGATVFTGDNTPQAIDINRSDGQKVTGLGFFQDVLIVFKERSIYQLYFNESNGFVVERITNSYGCRSHNSICAVENDTYFLNESGVFVLGNEPNFYAAIRTNELSSRIKNLLTQINPMYIEKSNAVYHNDRYWLSVPINSTTVNTLVVYDKRFYAWMVWDNIYANDFLVYADSSGYNQLYFSDDRQAQMEVFTPGVYNDNGQPITAVFRTRAFEGKVLDEMKYWQVLRPLLREAVGSMTISFFSEEGSVGLPISVNASLEGGIGLDLMGTQLFGTSLTEEYTDADFGLAGSGSSGSSVNNSSSVAVQVPINFYSRTCKVEYMNNRLNEGFALMGWVIKYQTLDEEVMDANYVYR